MSLFMSLHEILSHLDFCEADKNNTPDKWSELFQQLVDITYKKAQDLFTTHGHLHHYPARQRVLVSATAAEGMPKSATLP